MGTTRPPPPDQQMIKRFTFYYHLNSQKIIEKESTSSVRIDHLQSV